ncbi:DUF6080 domain-containing protein [Porphyromonas gingivalis]|uniref:DUF6080 domain-containing protein n=1 Tax=Porphyromonas gingivalis TaxID=837 RepID=UPI00097CDBF5|nr:DUF6080 domain-containing protein [Porphyromonas gingivalis]SJM20669.1 hypothetical protein PGIN_13-1_02001 [Porphyromonas gingivalis]
MIRKGAIGRLFSRYREEAVLCCILSLLYGALTMHIASTGLLTPHDGLIGAYLGYDNYYRFETAGGVFDISHPFLNLFYVLNRFGFVTIGGESLALGICLTLMTLCTAAGVTATYAYLRRVAGQGRTRSLLVTLLSAGSFTALTLPFTIESYPLSFFLLPLSITVLSVRYKMRGSFGGGTIRWFAFLLGGITLTNVAKPALAFLLEKGTIGSRIRKGAALAGAFSLTVLLVGLLFTYRAAKQGQPENDPRTLAIRMFDFRQGADESVAEYFGHPLLISDLAPARRYEETTLRPTPYRRPWSYIVPLLFLSTVVAAPLLRRREKLVWLLLLYLSVDVGVNVIGGYGMNEAVIFGGHWVFLWPMLLGWIYRSIPRKAYRPMDMAVFLFAAVQTVHNLSVILLRLHL